MNHHPSEERLNDYVDGLIADRDRERVDEHLAGCPDCRSAVAELRSLLERAAALPELPPRRDLLPGIRRAVSPGARNRFRWGALAASLVIVTAAAIGALMWKQRQEPGRTISSSGGVQGVSNDPAMDDIRAAEREFAEAAELLLAALDRRREALPPETVTAVEEDLASLDAAIAQVRQALEGSGERVRTGHVLTALHQKRMQMLWRVSRLSSQEPPETRTRGI